jgi:DNA polymerase (family 10)
MPVHNTDIAAVFSEMADLLELADENPFRVRAYRNAARIVGDHGRELRELVAGGEALTEIPGIGKDLAAKITELVNTGACQAAKDLRATFPPAITDLLRLQGMGPKKVKVLWKQLGIENLAQLEEAAKAGKIRGLSGFGEKTEQNILLAVQSSRGQEKRFKRAAVLPNAEELKAFLAALPEAGRVEVCGSYRRGRETVGDLDLLVCSTKAGPIMDAFTGYDEVVQVLAKGDTKSSVILRSGIQVDLRVVPEESYGAAFHYFTGSQAHNIALRGLAQKQGLRLNEYGLMKDETPVAGRTEEEIYRALGLAYVTPELREDRGEVEAAAAGKLPELVELRDLRGDLHNHSTWSDGANTIEEMARAAMARGFEYMAITDHSKRLTVANGLDENRLLKQIEEVDALNRKLKGFRGLKGIEVDILDNGELDLGDEVLGHLDVVVASVHSKFHLSRDKQTARIMKAMDHPSVSIIGHPTGRLILSREPYDVDMGQIIEHAKERGCCLEINANPERLDLNDLHARMAKEAGVILSIDCDGHQVRDFDNLIHGVIQARRAWLGKSDILNTKSLPALLAFLKQQRTGIR